MLASTDRCRTARRGEASGDDAMKRIPWDEIFTFAVALIFVAEVLALLFVVAPDVAVIAEVGR